MKTISPVTHLFAVMCVFAFASCGDDDKKSSTPSAAITGVADDTQVSDMTEEQQQAAVADIEAYIEAQVTPQETKQMACGTAGLFVAVFSQDPNPQAICQATYDDCMAQTTTSPTLEETSGVPEGPTSLENCTATVDEVNKCLAEEIAVFDALVAAMKCSNAGTASPITEDQTSPTPACEAIAARCPSLVDESSTD